MLGSLRKSLLHNKLHYNCTELDNEEKIMKSTSGVAGVDLGNNDRSILNSKCRRIFNDQGKFERINQKFFFPHLIHSDMISRRHQEGLPRDVQINNFWFRPLHAAWI